MTAMLAMIGWSLRRSRVGLGALLAGIIAFEFIQPIALNSFGDLEKISPLLSIVPPSFWSLLNVTPDFLTATGLSGYLSLGYTHPVYIIMLSTTVIWFACRGIAGEMERGTVQFALSRPVSRRRLYLSRMAALLLVSIVTAGVGPIGMQIGILAAAPDGSVPGENLLLTALGAWLLAWAIGGASMLGSAAASSMSKAIGWAIGVLVLMYVIDYFAALWSVLRPFQPISLFHYYDPAASMALGELSVTHVLVLLGVGLAGAIAGMAVFERRDLPV